MLEFKNICKSFMLNQQKINILNNVNFAIKKGDLTALIGPSGSGKTTILQIAGLLDGFDSGTLTIDGNEPSNSSDNLKTKFRRENIGFIYQFHHLLSEFSVIENVAMPLLIQESHFNKNSTSNISREFAFQQAKKFLSEVNLLSFANHRPSQLSGGQQQRVAIARAVIHYPKIILADEPTGNLDSVAAKDAFLLLKSIVKTHNLSCLMVTHNLELANNADQIIDIKTINQIN